MGLLATVAGPVADRLAGTPVFVLVAASIFGFVALSILLNVVRQIFLQNPNEPPVVFHWVPFLGSTITYGIDPVKFFSDCQQKVCYLASGVSPSTSEANCTTIARRCLYICSLGEEDDCIRRYQRQ